MGPHVGALQHDFLTSGGMSGGAEMVGDPEGHPNAASHPMSDPSGMITPVTSIQEAHMPPSDPSDAFEDETHQVLKSRGVPVPFNHNPDGSISPSDPSNPSRIVDPYGGTSKISTNPAQARSDRYQAEHTALQNAKGGSIDLGNYPQEHQRAEEEVANRHPVGYGRRSK